MQPIRWLAAPSRVRLQVAAFDTHVKKPNLPGRASHAAEKRLRRLGCQVVAKSATFYVDGIEGPLFPGEVDHARAWGTEVARAADASTSSGVAR